MIEYMNGVWVTATVLYWLVVIPAVFLAGRLTARRRWRRLAREGAR